MAVPHPDQGPETTLHKEADLCIVGRVPIGIGVETTLGMDARCVVIGGAPTGIKDPEATLDSDA